MRKLLIGCALLASACGNSTERVEPAPVPETAPTTTELTTTTLAPTTTIQPVVVTEEITTTTALALITTTTEYLREEATTTMVGRPAQNSSAELASIRECESGGDYTINTGNGYQGAYQYDRGTWATASSMAGYGEWATTPVSQVPAHIQDAVTANYISAGYRGAWPNC